MQVATVPIAEAARVLGIGTSTAYRLAPTGELTPGVPVFKIGGTYRVRVVDLERWAAGPLPATA
jgi:excisionase family DNA binding protein